MVRLFGIDVVSVGLKSYTWCSDTLEVILTLDLGYGGKVKVDSREVKKVQRVYAEVVSE